MTAPARGLAEFAELAADVFRLLNQADLDQPVPSCPGWTVADLIAHLGETHRWAAHAVREGNPDAPEVFPPVTDRAALADWYRDSAEDLISTLRTTDPDTECWAFGPRPRTARFWFRRQPHEVAMHRWDLATALGGDPGYPETLAADGIDEVVTMFFPRQVRLNRIPPLSAALALRADGDDRDWVLAGDGVRPLDGPADAEIGGPAAALVLLLWGRLSLDDPRLRLTGDRAAAAAVLSAGIVP
ncbi:MAG TPA: maleylpyruvate isomerase family mycothiol-dependent enzyme [Propionibacteriaceae bacterium]|nr:maleylpyruvate isomerase family mycothiol-dependent enzyme [Propionibacteriaceae bacterium]